MIAIMLVAGGVWWWQEARSGDGDNDATRVTSNAPAKPADATSAAGCDASLWQHVYHPSRLTILDNCKTVAGTISVIRQEADGDYHILLTLDQPYASLVNATNKSAQHGDLVLEPVCENPVTQSDATAACAGYRSPVHVPAVGTHVYVTGAYVLDTDHGWNEIHPVTAISTTAPAATGSPSPSPAASASPAAPGTQAAGVVKLSRTGICHVPSDPNYADTIYFTPYATLDECLAAGGRLPK
jgi:hypothetical protein